MRARLLKRHTVPNIPYLLFIWIFTKVCEGCRTAPGTGFIQKMLCTGDSLNTAFHHFMPSAAADVLIGLMCTAALRLIICARSKDAKKYRHGAEYGSARWGTAKDIAPFMDKNPMKNIILTASEGLTMESRPKNPDDARNKNVLVIGGSGSGKTRFFILPNLMQVHSSYVVNDPKGTLILECGHLLQHSGYKLRIFNTVNFGKSMHYNPFAYIKEETDILKLVTVLIENTKGEGNAGDEFWTKAEILLYSALIAYIHYEAPENERNFITLAEMINAMEVREDDEAFKNAVDMLFDALEEKTPQHFAVRQYRKFKLAAGKTAKSILISCGARLAPFDIDAVREITSYDELGLDMLGDEKTALFLITSDSDPTFDFLSAMVITQLFNVLCTRADDVYGGRLPIHVRCLLDEAANTKIPNLERLISTIRSREISAALVVQTQSQLKALYKDNADTVTGNCDSTVFLGGKETKQTAEALGKETIDLYNTSRTRGREESSSLQYQKTGRELMSSDEIAVMDGNKCIMQLRGVRPFLSRKYDITKHPNYKHLSDYSRRNSFSIEKYLSTYLKASPDDEYEYYEITPGELAAGR